MREFRSGSSRVLISTDLLARGIDVQQAPDPAFGCVAQRLVWLKPFVISGHFGCVWVTSAAHRTVRVCPRGKSYRPSEGAPGARPLRRYRLREVLGQEVLARVTCLDAVRAPRCARLSGPIILEPVEVQTGRVLRHAGPDDPVGDLGEAGHLSLPLTWGAQSGQATRHVVAECPSKDAKPRRSRTATSCSTRRARCSTLRSNDRRRNRST